MSNQYHSQTELFKDVYANNVYTNNVFGNGVGLSGVVVTDSRGNIPRDLAVLGALSARNLTLTGFLSTKANALIDGNLTITGNLTALGNTIFKNTIFSTTSALSVVNMGPGPALYIQQGPGSGDIASFYDGDGVEALHVGNSKYTSGQLESGVVGVNTGTPNKTLTVFGQISASGNVAFGPSPEFTSATVTSWINGSFGTSIQAGKSTDDGGVNCNISALKSRGTSLNPTAVQNGDQLGAYTFGGHDGSVYKTSSYLHGKVDGPVSAGIVPGSLSILTTDSTGATVERLRADSSGRVGINASGQTLTRTLNVFGDVSIGSILTTGAGVSTQDAAIEVGSTRTGNGSAYVDLISTPGADYNARWYRATGSNGNMSLMNTGTGDVYVGTEGAAQLSLVTSNAHRLFIKSNGYVGINGSNPETVLDVFNEAISLRGDINGFMLLAPKNGTSPVGNNYDRVELRVNPSSQLASFGTAHSGTGVARNFEIRTTGLSRMYFDTIGNVGVNCVPVSTYGRNTLEVSATIGGAIALTNTEYGTQTNRSVIWRDRNDGLVIAANHTGTESTGLSLYGGVMTVAALGNITIYNGYDLVNGERNYRPTMITNSSNRIGIGVIPGSGSADTDPRVYIKTSDRNSLLCETSYAGHTPFIIRNTNTSNASIPAISLSNWSQWSVAREVGQVRFDGQSTSGAYAEYAAIYATAGANTVNGAPTTLSLRTSDGTTLTSVDRLNIDSNGKVTIGRNAGSGFYLDVRDHLRVGSNSSKNFIIHLGTTGDIENYRSAYIWGNAGTMSIMNQSNAPFSLGTNNSELLVIYQNGRIVIGGADANVNHTLLVKGTLKTEGALTTEDLGCKNIVSTSLITGRIYAGAGISTDDVMLELGNQRTGVGSAYVDLITVPGTDHNARFYKGPGADGQFYISNTGNSNFQFINQGSGGDFGFHFGAETVPCFKIQRGTYKVGINNSIPDGQLDVTGAAVTSSLMNQQLGLVMNHSNGSNWQKLQFSQIRQSNAAGWEGVANRIQNKVDATFQGYVQFGGPNNTYGVSIGTGNGGRAVAGSADLSNSVDRLVVTSKGDVGIGCYPNGGYGRTNLQLYSDTGAILSFQDPVGYSLMWRDLGSSQFIIDSNYDQASISHALKLKGYKLNIVANATTHIFDDSGRLGIATTTPESPITINGGALGIVNVATAGQAGGYLLFGSSRPSNFGTVFDRFAIKWGIASDSTVYIGQEASSGFAARSLSFLVAGIQYPLHLNSDGLVGIGTNTPGHKLHVMGNVGASNFYTGEASGLLTSVNNSFTYHSGGNSAANGGSILFYGGSHATKPHALEFKTNNITRMNINSSGVVNVAGDMTVGGTLTPAALTTSTFTFNGASLASYVDGRADDRIGVNTGPLTYVTNGTGKTRGYYKKVGGLIFQMMRFEIPAGNYPKNFNFLINFPTACLSLNATSGATTVDYGDIMFSAENLGLSEFRLNYWDINPTSGDSNTSTGLWGVFVLAIGY